MKSYIACLYIAVIFILISTLAVQHPAIMVSARVEASDVVINEIDYDQPGTDTAEFIEIKNSSATSINLDDYSLELVGGVGDSGPYKIYDLPNVELASGDYYVVCGDAAGVTHCDLDVKPDINFIPDSAPSAVALVLYDDIVDTVSYEGDTDTPYTEGSGIGLEDNPALDNMGISRCPDGTDTDMNNVDFSPFAVTPGITNACSTLGKQIYLPVIFR